MPSKNSLVFSTPSSQYVAFGDVLSILNDQLGGIAGAAVYTVSVWVKSTQTSIAGLAGRTYFGGVQTRYFVFGNDSASGEAGGLFQDNGGGHAVVVPSSGWNDGNWHLLTFTGDDVSGVLYLDGTTIGTFSGGSGFVQNEATTKFLIGCADSGGGLTGFFTGKIAQPFVAWQTITSTQAANLFTGSLDPASLSGIRSLWYLSEGSGTSISDSGTAGNTGTLTNGVTWSSDIPSQLAGGISFDDASNSGYQAASASYSWSHTNAGNFLSVDVSLLSVPGTTVTGITYNGVALTKIDSQYTGTAIGGVECWGLVNPPVGTFTIAVTLSASVISSGEAVSYFGVDQTTPTESFNGAFATNVGAADATVNVTPITDKCWIHGAVATTDSSITAGQTSRNNVTGAGGSGANEDSNAAISPAALTATSFTGIGALMTWAIGGYAIRPVQPVVSTTLGIVGGGVGYGAFILGC